MLASPPVPHLVDALPEPMVVLHLDGVVNTINRAFTSAFGYTREDIVGRSFAHIVASSPASWHDFLRHCASTSQFVPGSIRLLHRAGHDAPCRVEGAAIRADGDTRLVVLRLNRKPSAATRFVELTQRIGDLSAEIVRRRRAEQTASEALEAERRVRERLTALAEASGTLVGSLAVSELLPAIGALASRLIPADAHAVWRADVTTGEWRAVWTEGLSAGFVAAIANWRGPRGLGAPLSEPLFVEDVTKLALLAERLPAYDAEGIRSLMIIPLKVRGDSYETVVAYHREPAAIGIDDRRVAAALGNLASSALEMSTLFEAESASRVAAQAAERRAEFLAQISAAFATTLDYEKTLKAITTLAVPEIADSCDVDLDVDASRVPDAPVLVSGAAKSTIRVPLRVHGRSLGTLTLTVAESGRRYDEADVRLALEIGWRAAIAIENGRAYAEVRQANRVKDEFLATLSHELRTPLNAVLGYARMIRSRTMTPEKQGHAVEVLERNAVALNQIVADILDVSRIVAGKIRLAIRPVDLSIVLHDAAATVQPAAEAKGVRLDTLVEPTAPAVNGDPDRLQQVVWNVLSNAVKFTPEGGRVELRLEHAGPRVRIVVRDSGVGIKREFLPHLFERFRQADSGFARQHGGLGLGLAISRHLVEMHGGTIVATSEGEGRGATFTVELPARPAPRAGVEQPAPALAATLPPPTTGPAQLAGIRVLAIDDEHDALALMSELLESAGAEVMTAPSGLSALERLAQADAPHVLLSDIGMAGMDGFDLIRRVRQSAREEIRQLPAIAVTAYARSEDRAYALQCGYQAYLAKPIDPAALVAAVRALAIGEPSA